jgi:hypothetical protein
LCSRAERKKTNRKSAQLSKSFAAFLDSIGAAASFKKGSCGVLCFLSTAIDVQLPLRREAAEYYDLRSHRWLELTHWCRTNACSFVADVEMAPAFLVAFLRIVCADPQRQGIKFRCACTTY